MGRPGSAAVASAAGAAEAGGTLASGAAQTATTTAEGAAPGLVSAERAASRAATSEPGPVAPGARASRTGAGDILAAAMPIVGLPAIGAAAFWAGGSLLETPGERAGRRAADPGRMALLRWSLEQRQPPATCPPTSAPSWSV